MAARRSTLLFLHRLHLLLWAQLQSHLRCRFWLQGMNFVAACLMLFMGEEEAFWCLVSVVEDLLPGYFHTRMVAPQVWQGIGWGWVSLVGLGVSFMPLIKEGGGVEEHCKQCIPCHFLFFFYGLHSLLAKECACLTSSHGKAGLHCI